MDNAVEEGSAPSIEDARNAGPRVSDMPRAESALVHAETAAQSGPYFPALDGLRAFALFAVFLQHYLGMPWGWAGVDLFFVLSGFLITGILYDTQSHPHHVRNFYVRRTLRIFPLYYGLIALFLLSYPIFHWWLNWGWMVWPLYVGNFARFVRPIQNTSMLHLIADCQPLSLWNTRIQLSAGHLWSLCVEEQFYLVWPWIVFWVRDRRKLIGVCLACVVLCPALRVLGQHMLPHWMIRQEVLYRATPFRIDALLLGGLIALLQRGAYRQTMLRAARAGFLLLGTVVVGWAAWGGISIHWQTYVYPEWAFTWGLTLVDLLAACLIVLALHRGTVVFRVFNQPVLRWFGRISYGLYIFHDIPHALYARFVQQFTGHWVVPTAALAFGCTVLLAWSSYRWFERPFIRMKDRWTE